jgi:arylsulfatase A-like enzyme
MDQGMVELVDLAPTIADYLGIAVRSEWQWEGDSLFGRSEPGTTAIADRGGKGFQQSGIRSTSSAVRYSWKQDRWAYYDLDPEPREEDAHRVRPPTAEHQQLRDLLQHYMDTAKPPGQEGQELDAPEGSELEALQALGYME